jgi:WD40 repeat protein
LKKLEGHSDGIIKAIYSPDGNLIASIAADKMVRLWEGHTGTFIKELRGHRDNVIKANFSSSGSFLMTASLDGSAIIWDISTGNILIEFGERGNLLPISNAFLSPDGKWFFINGELVPPRIYNCEILGSLNDLLQKANSRYQKYN